MQQTFLLFLCIFETQGHSFLPLIVYSEKMSAVFAKIVHNGIGQTVALYEGLNADELSNLLKTVFNISGHIVGLMAEVREYLFC